MQSKPTILIIGAGLAGLAAASRLVADNYQVTVLEARPRIGGRTWTDFSLNVPFDQGAFVIHGIQNNPMVELCQQFNAKFIPISINSIWFANQTQQFSETELETIHDQFNQLVADASVYARQAQHDMTLAKALHVVYNIKDYPALTKPIYNWRSTFLTLYAAAEAKHLSARHWDEDETPFEGGNGFMLDGYLPIVTGLAQKILINLNTQVTRINYSGRSIKVETNNGTYEADKVIITVPLGVLKKAAISFGPPLPIVKKLAIARLEMGLLNKMALKFAKPFWPVDPKMIRISNLTSSGLVIPWFLNYQHYFNEPVLVGAVAGDSAHEFEKLNDEDVCHAAMKALRQLFGNNIPNPTGYIITRWGQDIFSYGSYSYIPLGATGADYDSLSQPVENKLFFAGEATNRFFPGTTHGAYLSGIREAERILGVIR